MTSKKDRQAVSAGVVETIHILRHDSHSEDDHAATLASWLEFNQSKIVDAACERLKLSRAMLGETSEHEADCGCKSCVGM